MNTLTTEQIESILAEARRHSTRLVTGACF
jgi:hypothetical protein